MEIPLDKLLFFLFKVSRTNHMIRDLVAVLYWKAYRVQNLLVSIYISFPILSSFHWDQPSSVRPFRVSQTSGFRGPLPSAYSNPSYALVSLATFAIEPVLPSVSFYSRSSAPHRNEKWKLSGNESLSFSSFSNISPKSEFAQPLPHIRTWW